MYGGDIGQLEVFVERVSTNLSTILSTLVWAKSGDQGNKWYPATQTLHNLNSTEMYGWQIVFEGVVGEGFLSDIALDDIFLSDSTCQPSRACDFEFSLCEYEPNPNESWIRQQAANLSNFVNEDHTLITSLGHFAMATQDNTT